MRNTVIFFFMVYAMACIEPEGLRPEIASSTSSVNPSIKARPCRADSFYVEVPLQVLPAWSNTNFLGDFGADLTGIVNTPTFPWFCGADEITCPTNGPIEVVITQLLDKKTENQLREDGHLRFFRIEFRDPSDSVLSVRPDQQCTAVDTIRGLFSGHTMSGPRQFYVGRECDASGLGIQAMPSDEMLNWHLERMGVPGTSTVVVAPDPIDQTVDLVLIDSGVIEEVSQAPDGIGVTSTTDLVSSAGFHAHGTGMAILARQLAPNARLHSIRVLGAGGGGMGGAIAQALDQALFELSDPKRPLIINLSLGWPTELGRTSDIGGTGCSSYEDPFGESARYMLDIARRMDQSDQRPVFVAAAAGNRPIRSPTSLFPPSGVTSLTPCSEAASSGEPWFFPAEWTHTDSCRAGMTDFTRIAFGVSAIDDRNLKAPNAIPDAEAPLVAPGTHVYVSHPLAPSPPSTGAPECGSTSAFPPQVTLPRAFSGSSVGSAFISAAAARIQAARIQANRTPLDAVTLARILYLTGRSLCRLNPDGVLVRRLDIGRAEEAVVSEKCSLSLLACAANASDEWISAGLLEHCKNALVSCRLEMIDKKTDALLPNCVPQEEGLTWPSDYTPLTCKVYTAPATFEDVATCGSLCPFETAPLQGLVGSLGPQPGGPTCPDCQMQLNLPAGTYNLIVELSTDFPLGTTFSSPYLAIQGPVGAQTMASFVNLLTMTLPSDWAPGMAFQVSGPFASLPAFEWPETQVGLIVKVQQGDLLQESVENFSSVRLEVQ